MAPKRSAKRFRNYGGNFTSATDRVVVAGSRADIRTVLDWAYAKGKKITLRAAGNALDRQSLPPRWDDPEFADTWVLDLSRVPASRPQFSVLKAGRDSPRVRVDGWMTWGDLLTAVTRKRLVLPVAVTSSRVTVAGAIAAGGLSRFSPLVGKLYDHIHWLGVRFPNVAAAYAVFHPAHFPTGALPTDLAGWNKAPDQATNDLLFNAIVGGHGLVGVIMDAVLFLQDSRSLQLRGRQTLAVATSSSVPTGWDALSDSLVADAQRTAKLRAGVPVGPATGSLASGMDIRTPTVFAIAYPNTYDTDHDGLPDGGRAECAALISSWYTTSKAPSSGRFFLWRRRLNQLGSNLVMPLLPRAADGIERRDIWGRARKPVPSRPGRRVKRDPIDDYTFFMEFHTWSRNFWRRMHFGRDSGTVQQTFAIPIVDAHGNYTSASVKSFLQAARSELRTRPYVMSQAMDLLHLPESHALLSATRGSPGIAVTFGIERAHWYREGGRRKPWDSSPAAAMARLARICCQLGGRVHLGKNAYVEPAVLAKMYEGSAKQWQTVRSTYDANGVLTSRFDNEVLQPLLRALAAGDETCSPATSFEPWDWQRDIRQHHAQMSALAQSPSAFSQALAGTLGTPVLAALHAGPMGAPGPGGPSPAAMPQLQLGPRPVPPVRDEGPWDPQNGVLPPNGGSWAALLPAELAGKPPSQISLEACLDLTERYQEMTLDGSYEGEDWDEAQQWSRPAPDRSLDDPSEGWEPAEGTEFEALDLPSEIRWSSDPLDGGGVAGPVDDEPTPGAPPGVEPEVEPEDSDR